MKQVLPKAKANVAQIGEDIGLQLGKEMITSFNEVNPTETNGYLVGKEIITNILLQPGCQGIRFYNGYNEMGEKVLVYVGVDAAGEDIIKYSTVNTIGELKIKKGIVADRGVRTPGIEADDFGWWSID